MRDQRLKPDVREFRSDFGRRWFDRCQQSASGRIPAARPAGSRLAQGQWGAPSDSRNAGLAMATGEYVAFVDHDDRLEPTSFAQLMALQERTQAEIVMANFFFHVEGEAGFQVAFSKDDYFEQVYTPTEWLAMEYKRDFGISECFSAPWGKLYRRQLWDDVTFPVDQAAEDD